MARGWAEITNYTWLHHLWLVFWQALVLAEPRMEYPPCMVAVRLLNQVYVAAAPMACILTSLGTCSTQNELWPLHGCHEAFEPNIHGCSTDGLCFDMPWYLQNPEWNMARAWLS